MHKGEIDIITLGCSKNLVDAERVMRRLQTAGFTCVHDAPAPKGEIAIINTCGFIGDAKEESIRMILEMVERKKKRQLRQLYVMGCLSQRYSRELPEEIPEVDGWYGKFDYDALIERLAVSHWPLASAEHSSSANSQQPTANSRNCATYERTITTPKHYTYVKISEGCNRFCSYCAIPLITGRHTSRPMEEILDEVRWLVKQGVKEFNIIAQDLSSYGLDLYKQHRLAELIDRMAQIEGVRWIRLHYAYPTDFPYDILPVMAKHENICKYLDIALQHCTDHMLSLMRRHITAAEQDELLDRIRHEVPDITLRTTLLVGHPGETEEDFIALKQWVIRQRFDRMGAFAYSDEEGTYANLHYKDDIPQQIKDRRVAEIMAIQEQIAAEKNEEKVGKTLTTIIDRLEGDYYIGRTQADSPEVDQEVLIKADCQQQILIGEIYPVKITQVEGFDLYGEVKGER